jgi:hypothetical protein
VTSLEARNQGLAQKFKRRVQGVPRRLKELERSLALLAVFRALGWHRSVSVGAPVDADGEPLPWLTYPAIAWLEHYVHPSHVIYEYGAGYSTLWFAKRAAKVHSIEHNAAWVARLRNCLPSNADLTLAAADEGEYSDRVTSPYARSIAAFPDRYFDIILIDGMERGGCAVLAPPKLRPDGILIFDNSDRPGHHAVLRRLREDGFGRVDFIGNIPGYWNPGCTSVLFRQAAPFLRSDAPPFQGY